MKILILFAILISHSWAQLSPQEELLKQRAKELWESDRDYYYLGCPEEYGEVLDCQEPDFNKLKVLIFADVTEMNFDTAHDSLYGNLKDQLCTYFAASNKPGIVYFFQKVRYKKNDKEETGWAKVGYFYLTYSEQTHRYEDYLGIASQEYNQACHLKVTDAKESEAVKLTLQELDRLENEKVPHLLKLKVNCSCSHFTNYDRLALMHDFAKGKITFSQLSTLLIGLGKAN
jgi:hypothetical protein